MMNGNANTKWASNMTETERWWCDNCGHEDDGQIDELVGKQVTKTVGEGRRTKTIETVVCPNCHSEQWYSQGVHDLLGNDRD